ncbi:elongation factor P [Candidatus Gracilibacteria bacterium]|nr:elongation factor P [Candidatus Gracilibacteria bacterium]
MITAMQIKTGGVIKMGNDLLLPLKRELHRGGRGATNIKVRFKNLINGNIVDKVFDSEEKLEDIVLERSKFEFLYESGGVYYFMDQETYEQIEISEEDMGDAVNFITPSLIVDIQRFEGRLVGVILPASVKLLITECEPGVKGNTADGKITKEAILETGYAIKVPGFVESGEYVIINTETGEYQERAK